MIGRAMTEAISRRSVHGVPASIPGQ